VTLYPGSSVDLFIGDQYVMKIEPVLIADHVSEFKLWSVGQFNEVHTEKL